MNIPLYELSLDENELKVLLDENPTDEAIAKALESVQGDKVEKLKQCGLVCKELQMTIDAWKAEKDRIAEKTATLENSLERLKKYISNNIGDYKIKTPQISYSFRKSEAVVITCEVDALPFQYISTTVTPNKIKLKEALKAGQEIEGVLIEERQNLQIE